MIGKTKRERRPQLTVHNNLVHKVHVYSQDFLECIKVTPMSFVLTLFQYFTIFF